jgi:hypothetical protein
MAPFARDVLYGLWLTNQGVFAPTKRNRNHTLSGFASCDVKAGEDIDKYRH